MIIGDGEVNDELYNRVVDSKLEVPKRWKVSRRRTRKTN